MDGCIDHGRTKSLSPEGYALVYLPGKRNRRSRFTRLHRLVLCQYENITLESIFGLCVMHTCDNTRCINPEHLVLGDRGLNNKDSAAKGRSAKVVKSRHKLTREQALEIQKRYSLKKTRYCKENGVSRLAKDYCVDPNVIYNIVRGEHKCLIP